MKTWITNFIIGPILFLIAYVLFLPISILNLFFVGDKRGYFFNSALNFDKYGNRELRSIFNKCLRKEGGYMFGREGETISSVLGKNERDGTLTNLGKKIVVILNTIDKDHCKKSIQEFI